MSYMTAQGLIKTLLLTNTNLVSGSVTEGDYRVLDSSYTNSAVLLPGSVPSYDTSGMTRSQQWTCILDLFCRFVDDTSYASFGTLRDSVMDTIIAAPCLSAVYTITEITTDGDPVDINYKDGSGPVYVSQRLNLSIEENV